MTEPSEEIDPFAPARANLFPGAPAHIGNLMDDMLNEETMEVGSDHYGVAVLVVENIKGNVERVISDKRNSYAAV